MIGRLRADVEHAFVLDIAVRAFPAGGLQDFERGRLALPRRRVIEGAFLRGVVVGDGEGHQLFKRQIAIAIDLHQFRGYRAEPQALPHHMRRHTEAGSDLLRTEAPLFRQLLKGLELVGGMHVFPGDILVQADFVRIVRGVDDTADRLGLLDFLPLHPQKLGKPPALTDGHEIKPRDCSFSVQLRFDYQILEDTLGGDARRIRLDRRFAVRRLARVLRRLLELVERNENLRPALGDAFNLLGRHDQSPFAFMGAGRTPRLRPCPLARPGVASARANRAEGDHPPARAARESGSARRMPVVRESEG